MEGLQPVVDLGGNSGMGNGLGALIGGAIGGAVGSGWNGNRWCNNGCGGGNAAYGELFLMDSLSGLRSDVGSIGRDQLMQSASAQSTMCQGFGGVNATVERTAAAGQLTAAQGFAGLNTAITTASLQGQLGLKDVALQNCQDTANIVSAIKDCCCTTNANTTEQGCATRSAIHEEGERTRALIEARDRENLLRALNAAEAENAVLKGQAFQTTLAQQTAANIIAHIPTSSGGTPSN